MEKISVIIPISERSEPEYLLNCLEAIFNSSYRNLEVMLLADKSHKTIEQKVEEYHSDIILLSGKYKNFSIAANHGLEKCTGDLISFMDLKDINGKMRLEMLVKQMADKPKIGMTFCGSTFIDMDGNFLKGVSKCPDISGNKIQGNLFEKNFINSISATLIRKKVMTRIGGFDEKIDADSDYDLYLRLLEVTHAEYVNLPLLRLRVNGKKINSFREKYDYTPGELFALRKFDVGAIGAGLSFIYRNEEDFRISFGKILYQLGESKLALHNFYKAVEINEECSESYFYAGNCHFSNGKFKKALADYQKCLAINAEHGECLKNMGFLYEKIGDKKKSKLNLTKAQEILKSYSEDAFGFELKNSIQQKINVNTG